jgi:hypothetical protein
MSITQQILDDMGTDNGCTFRPCSQHQKELDETVAACVTEGLKFTPSQISTLSYGEETAQQRLYKKFPSGPKLNRVLNDIFDGCRKCRSVSRF